METALLFAVLFQLFWSVVVPVLVVVAIVRFIQRARRQGQPPAAFGSAETSMNLDPSLQELQRMLEQLQRAGNVSPEMQARFTTQMLNAQRSMRDMDSLRRQQSELFISRLQSDAASNGIYVDLSQ